MNLGVSALRSNDGLALHDFESDPGLSFGGFNPEQGAHCLGDLPLLADDPAFVVVGDAQLQRDALLVGLLFDIHCVRFVDDGSGDVLY